MKRGGERMKEVERKKIQNEGMSRDGERGKRVGG